jgi:hypothetical protein
MILKKMFSCNNYRYILYLALIAFLFASCQNKDPLVYFQKESLSMGYKKVTSSTDNKKYEFGENSVLNIADSLHDLSVIIPEITSFNEFEVFYSLFGEKDYTILILCKGLGEKLRNKMIYDKEVNNFNYTEIFNEKNSFISPVDENNLLISSSMEDIKKSIKRSEGKSVVSNEIISALKKEIPENSTHWFITIDNKKISALTNPFAIDSASNFTKNLSKYKSLIYFDNGKPSVIIDGEDDNSTVDQITKDLKTESTGINYSSLNSKIPSYRFSNIDITNNNNKFRIIIK